MNADDHHELSPTAMGRITQKLAAERARGLTGRQLGLYQVQEKLGEGGFGEVYRALDTEHNQLVALKILKPEHANHPASRELFVRESKRAAEVKSNYVVEVRSILDLENFTRPILVMELVEGESLRERLQRHAKLTPLDAAKLIRDAALGLAAVHERQLVHRDVKPANILLDATTGQAKITDFGLTRRVTGESRNLTTRNGALIATARYVSPEQVQRPNAVDHRSDIYSLGVVLFETLMGRAQFEDTTDVQTILQHVLAEPPALNATIAPALHLIYHRCVEKEPSRRYASAQALADALQAFLDGKGTFRANLELRWLKTTRWVLRHPVRTVVAVAMLVLASLLVSGTWWHIGRLNEQIAQTQEEAYKANLLDVQVAINDADYQRLIRSLDRCQERRDSAWQTLSDRWDTEHQRLPGHRGGVRGIAFSPNGRLVATCGDDGTIQIWTPTGEKIRQLRGHMAAVNTVAFWPYTSSRLISASADGTVRVWDIPEGKEADQEIPKRKDLEPSQEASPQPRTGLAFSYSRTADSYNVVWSSTSEGTIHAWDLLTGRRLSALTLRHIGVIGLAADAQTLFSFSRDGSVKVWDALTGKLGVTYTPENPVTATAWGATTVGQGQTLSVAEESGTIRVYQRIPTPPTTVKKQWLAPGLHFTAMAWQSDNAVLTAGENGSIVLWQDGYGAARRLIAGHRATVTALAVSPTNPGLVISGDANGDLKFTSVSEAPKIQDPSR